MRVVWKSICLESVATESIFHLIVLHGHLSPLLVELVEIWHFLLQEGHVIVFIWVDRILDVPEII